MLKSTHLGGWTRLWIILSAIWIVGAIFWVYSEWPAKLPNYSDLPFQLSDEQQSLILIGSVPTEGVSLQLSNGYTLRCKRQVSQEICEKIGRDYLEVAARAVRVQKKSDLCV